MVSVKQDTPDHKGVQHPLFVHGTFHIKERPIISRRGRRQHDVGLGLSHSESIFPRSRKILGGILAGLPDDEQPEIVGLKTAARVAF